MKILRDNALYVELSDIIILAKLPDVTSEELANNYNRDDLFIKFQDEESICFFNKKECIIDYDYVSNLSDDEIDKEISCIEYKLDNMFKDNKKTFFKNSNNYNDIRLRMLKILKHNLYSLINYKSHRKIYDDYVSLNIDNAVRVRGKVN